MVIPDARKEYSLDAVKLLALQSGRAADGRSFGALIAVIAVAAECCRVPLGIMAHRRPRLRPVCAHAGPAIAALADCYLQRLLHDEPADL